MTVNSQGRKHGFLSLLKALTALWDCKLLLGWADASVNFVSLAASSECSLKRKVNKVLRGKSGGSCLRKAMGSQLAGRNASSHSCKNKKPPQCSPVPCPTVLDGSHHNSLLSLTPFLLLSLDSAQELEAASLDIVSHPQAAQGRGT